MIKRLFKTFSLRCYVSLLRMWRRRCFHGINAMILMPQIFDVTANENARYKRNELEYDFGPFSYTQVFVGASAGNNTEAAWQLYWNKKKIIYIHVKLEKFKRGRSPSLHLAKEGDLRETVPRHLFCPGISNSSWIFFNMGTYSLFLVAYNSLYDAKTFLHCAWWTLCCLTMHFHWKIQ